MKNKILETLNLNKVSYNVDEKNKIIYLKSKIPPPIREKLINQKDYFIQDSLF